LRKNKKGAKHRRQIVPKSRNGSQCNARIYGTCPQGPASVSCVQRSSSSNSTAATAAAAATSTAPQQQKPPRKLALVGRSLNTLEIVEKLILVIYLNTLT